MFHSSLSAGFLMGILLVMGLSCEFEIPDPQEPTPAPTPIVPIPTAEPVRFGIYAPAAVPTFASFSVIFCGKTFANEVFIDDFRIGYLGDNRKSGCLQLIIPGLNTPGRRVIKVGTVSQSIDVFEFKSEM